MGAPGHRIITQRQDACLDHPASRLDAYPDANRVCRTPQSTSLKPTRGITGLVYRAHIPTAHLSRRYQPSPRRSRANQQVVQSDPMLTAEYLFPYIEHLNKRLPPSDNYATLFQLLTGFVDVGADPANVSSWQPGMHARFQPTNLCAAEAILQCNQTRTHLSSTFAIPSEATCRRVQPPRKPSNTGFCTARRPDFSWSSSGTCASHRD